MTTPDEIHYQEWGDGPPVLALHGLGLESSSFTGLAEGVTQLGLRMMAADLPGFGLTPAPETPLTPAVLAEPVLELAARLDTKPLVMGMSLGARVALEAALEEPDLFRGAVMMAPPLPRRKHRWILLGAHLLSPEIAKRIPVEIAWPWLKKRADRLESELQSDDKQDWFLVASKRTIYYISCPATRWSFVSAARELALDPAFGPDGLWTRLDQLKIPTAFVWGDQDRFIGTKDIPAVEELLPGAFQIRVPCAGHFDNGPHFLCMEAGAIEAVRLVEEAARRPGWSAKEPGGVRVIECLADRDERETATVARSPGTMRRRDEKR
jgi:pimeloyl-ACP methyl ester carboxylesterase